MRPLPAFRRAAVALLTLLLALILYIPIQQHILRTRAERLHAEILALQLHPGTFADIQRMQTEWGAHAHYDGPCTQHHCIYTITLNDIFLWWSQKYPNPEEGSLVFAAVRILETYAFLGGHPTQVYADLRVRDNRMWGADFGFYVMTYPGTGRNEGHPYAVFTGTNLGTRLSPSYPPVSIDAKALRLGFWVNKEMHCLGCEEVAAHLTQQTSPQDIVRLNQLDLSCITRWLPCRHPEEMAPELWKQAVDDEPIREDDPEACTLSPIVLAREANDIVLVKVISLQNIRDPDALESIPVATVQVLQPLKNGRLYRGSDQLQFPIAPDSIRPEAGESSPKPAIGKQYLFLYRQPRPNSLWGLSLEPCRGLLATPENTALIQQGIALDPSAGEPYDYLNEP